MSVMVFAGWGYWYLHCSILWTLSGFIWFAWPSLAARIGAFPILGNAALMAWLIMPPYRGRIELDPILWLYGLQVLCVAIALALTVTTIRNTSFRNFTPLVISFGLVSAGFLVDKTFVDKTEFRTYSMNWTADGTAPWGRVDFDEKDGPPVVLYRKYGQGYCVDELYSPELKRRLIESNKPLVNVEYSVTRDFGRERGYNIQSVNGLVFAVGDHEVRPGLGRGGFVSSASGSGPCKHK
jgi:hypothetical protein